MAGRSTRSLGTEGEQIAVRFLQANNYTILKTNYRVGRMGEIDIIAINDDYICFIEVKTRSSYSFGAPSEAVTFEKQKKIRMIATVYLSNTGNMDKNIRFDVVGILKKNNDSRYETESINLIKNAF